MSPDSWVELGYELKSFPAIPKKVIEMSGKLGHPGLPGKAVSITLSQPITHVEPQVPRGSRGVTTKILQLRHNSTIAMTITHATIIAEVLADIPTQDSILSDLRKEINDPEVSVWLNLCSHCASEWENFNSLSGEFMRDGQDGGGEDDDDDVDDDDDGDKNDGVTHSHRRKRKKRKIHKRQSYHYKIGNYEAATYYTKFLSNEEVCLPGASDSTVGK